MELYCVNCKRLGRKDTACPRFLFCDFIANGKCKGSQMANVIANKNLYYTEVVVRNEPFIVALGEQIAPDADRTRKFIMENGVIKPINPESTLADFERSHAVSGHRSLDMYWGLALSNVWSYFITLTFDPKKVNRSCEEELKYHWKLFRQKLQYINPEVKILCVPEQHPTSGMLHFHCLVGNIELIEGVHYKKAINSKKYRMYDYDYLIENGKYLKTKYGDTVYNLLPNLYDKGFNTLVKIGFTPEDQQKVVNYLCDYTTKESDAVGFGKRRYYRTQNLRYKDKRVSLLTPSEIDTLLENPYIVEHKKTDQYTVYRIPNNVEQMKID